MAEIEDDGRTLRIVDEKDLSYAYNLMDEAMEALGRDNMRLFFFTLGRIHEALSDMRWNSPEAHSAPTAGKCGMTGSESADARRIGSERRPSST